jgi:glyoxylase-like metal-dependent hydrolase (beta-lactamase superfamily II)
MNDTKIAKEITQNLFFIEGINKGRYPYSNSILIKDETTALVDSGAGEEIMCRLAKNDNIDLLINSHAHEDHIACNNLFSANICIHELEMHVLDSVTDKLVEIYGCKNTVFDREMTFFIENFVKYEKIKVFIGFKDGFVFDLGDTKLRVIHTPGHSKGHSCLFDEKDKILFSADIDLSSFGPWYGATDSDIDKFIESIDRVKRLKPEIIISSHKGIVEEDIDVRLDEYKEKIYEREEKILGFIGGGKTMNEIVDEFIIYGNISDDLKQLYRPFEKNMIEKHLDRLIRNNKVAKEDNYFKVV